jgi:hypothetical protein
VIDGGPAENAAGTAHAPAVHTPLSQSLAAEHGVPSAHAGQVPPQSICVSPLLRKPSLQLGDTQRPAVHVPLWQSLPRPQLAPSPHPAQLPPQSISLSSALRV